MMYLTAKIDQASVKREHRRPQNSQHHSLSRLLAGQLSGSPREEPARSPGALPPPGDAARSRRERRWDGSAAWSSATRLQQPCKTDICSPLALRMAFPLLQLRGRSPGLVPGPLGTLQGWEREKGLTGAPSASPQHLDTPCSPCR